MKASILLSVITRLAGFISHWNVILTAASLIIEFLFAANKRPGQIASFLMGMRFQQACLIIELIFAANQSPGHLVSFLIGTLCIVIKAIILLPSRCYHQRANEQVILLHFSSSCDLLRINDMVSLELN